VSGGKRPGAGRKPVGWHGGKLAVEVMLLRGRARVHVPQGVPVSRVRCGIHNFARQYGIEVHTRQEAGVVFVKP
jgi:hypothetical protein